MEGMSLCLEAANLLVMTGGLGPTSDDLTVDALCQYFDCKKVWHEETWDRVKEILKRLGREPAEMHKLQCYQPDAAEIIPNDQGSAPGTIFRKGNKIAVSYTHLDVYKRQPMGIALPHQPRKASQP